MSVTTAGQVNARIKAVLRRMGPIQALDAWLYLSVNGQPHPKLLDRLCNLLTIITTGGWIWILATLVARHRFAAGNFYSFFTVESTLLAVTSLLVSAFVVVNMLVDLLNAVLDPRLVTA